MKNIIFIYIGTYVAHIEQPCIYSFALGMSIKMPSLGSKIQQVCTATFVMYALGSTFVELTRLNTICNYLKNNLRHLKINLDIIKFSRQKCDKIML